MNSQYPVFFDPNGRRKRLTKFLALGILLVLLALVGIFFFSFFSNPLLPQFRDAAFKKTASLKAYLGPEKQLQDNQAELKWYKKWHSEFSSKGKTLRKKTTNNFEYSAFFVNWDDASLTSLQKNASQLDVLFPEWLHLTPSSQPILDNPEKQISIKAMLKKSNPELHIMPVLNNIEPGQKWNPKLVHDLVANPKRWPKFFDYMENYLTNNEFSGVILDFENLNDSDWDGYLAFLSQFSTRLHAKNLKLAICLAVAKNTVDYVRLGQVVDQVVVMAYDQHWSTGDPGPIAAADWVAKHVRQLLSAIPQDKISVAVGNYGYDWTGSKRAQALSFQEAMQLANEASANVQLDPRSWNYNYRYISDGQESHQVWFLDAVSVFNLFKTLQLMSINRFSLWRLGSEDPSLWSFFGSDLPIERFNSRTLRQIPSGYDVTYQGAGEILHVIQKPRKGYRTIIADSGSGIVVRSHYVQFPSSFVIGRQGNSNPNMIAITFDDGPNSRFTPQILDILKDENVKATFFIIGEYANRYPKLLKRIQAEGHLIGNHTYTHPNIAEISSAHLRLELNTTQRLFESRLGVTTVLFRPPYAEDVEPSSPDQAQTMSTTSKLGYLTVGIHIDPKDWSNPGVDTIVQNAITQAESGNGHVMLLHDGGGDRSETIEALPRIINELKQRGYTFGTVADVLGVSANALMVPTSHQDQLKIFITGLALWAIHWVGIFFFYLFFLTVLIGMSRAVTLCVLSVLHVFFPVKPLSPERLASFKPFLTVIIPAFNEEKVVVRTVKSVLASQYPQFEVVVVNDGSTDNTYAVMKETFGADAQVTVLDQPNGGKSRGINHGISVARGEIVIVLDADTLLDSMALHYLSRHFLDPSVAAVSGNAKVGNRVNLLTKCQSLEYITSQNLDKRAYEWLNCITVVPGAIGAWRTSVLAHFGGFSDETLAEDSDMTIKILNEGRKILYEPLAIAYTEAPEKFSAFLKQRFRWIFGNLQVLYKNRHRIFNYKHGWLGIFALPNMLLFQVVFPLMTPILEISIVIRTLGAITDALFHNGRFDVEGVSLMLGYYALFMSIDFVMCWLGFLFEPMEDKSQMRFFMTQRLMYRPIMIYLSVKSLIAANQGKLVGWNKFERSGSDLKVD